MVSTRTVKQKQNVAASAAAGGMIGGPAGAFVGALAAAEANAKGGTDRRLVSATYKSYRLRFKTAKGK